MSAVAQMRDLSELAALLGIEIDSDEIEFAQARSGKNSLRLKFKRTAAGGNNDHNWWATLIDSTHLIISPSVVNTTYPTIGGTSINASTPPQLTVSASAKQWICLKLVFSHTIVNGIITAGTITTATIAAHSSMPSNTTTDRYFLLFTHQAGTIIYTTFWNLGIECRDDGTATSTPEYRTWVAS
jgi:hypothetical protein